MNKAAWIGVLAMAALSAALAVPARAASAAPALIAEVQTALDRGDAQHAATLAETGLKESWLTTGERARLQLYHGLAQELLGSSDAAMQDFTLALSSRALPPAEQAQALLQRGFLRDGMGRLAEASADYGAVIALKGEGLATALNNRANIHRRQSRWAEAKADYQAALAAGSGRAQYSWYGLGQIAEAQGDNPGARAFYARAVAADPAYAAPSQRLAALGGPGEGATPASPAEPIILRPPSAKPLAQAGPSPGRPVTLKPPASRTAAGPRPPMAVRRVTPPPPRLDLRPALDREAVRGRPGQQVQLGAWRSEAEAQAGWQKARARAGAILENRRPQVAVADLPGRGRYYRLRINPVAGESLGDLCESLADRGIGCFPVRD
jgi:tetratricopeptide (TPR) repeat protein